MKNSIRRLLAFLLAAAVCFGSLTAFAADNDTVLYWYPYNESSVMELEYAGEFTGDKIVIDNGLSDRLYRNYYSIEFPQTGYYLVSVKAENIYYSDIIFPQSVENGKAYGIKDSVSISRESVEDGGIIRSMYYFSEEETVFGVSHRNDVIEVEIDFMGEAITDIVFDDNAFCGIADYDFSENNVGDVDFYDADAKIIFSSGEQLDIEDGNFVLDVESSPVKGENEAVVRFFEYSEPVKLTVFEITDYIENIDIDTSDAVTAKIYYDDYIELEWLDFAMTFRVTFTDGTTENVSNIIKLPNGREYLISVSFSETDIGECSVTPEVAFYSFGTQKLAPTEASFAENYQYLNRVNSRRWSDAVREAERSISCLGNADSTEEMATIIFWFPTLFTSAIYDIFCNTIEFLEYYATR